MEHVVPATMKRLVLIKPAGVVSEAELTVQEVPMPKPQSGEVLIKVSAAVVNPSDFSFFLTLRTSLEQCPLPLGKEGSGVIVASGGGCFTAKVGAKVGFGIQTAGQGAWSEYVVVSSMKAVFPMPDSLPIQDAASFFVNPFTACGIFDTVRKSTTNNTFVHLAAASQLGQMMVKLAKVTSDVTIINVVRREEQAELLRSIGAKHVIVTGKSDAWEEELKQLMQKLKCTCVFDPVAGAGTGQMLSFLPEGGKLFCYGGLAGRIAGVNPVDLIYGRKELNGFFLSSWISEGGVFRTLSRIRAASKLINPGLAGGWSSTKFVDTTLEGMKEDLDKQQKSGVTDSKLRIRF